MELNYSKLITDYFKLDTLIRVRRKKAQKYITDSSLEIAKLEKLNSRVISNDHKAVDDKYRSIESKKQQLEDYKKTENESIEAMQRKFNMLKNILGSYKICFEDILLSTVPNYNKNLYDMNISHIFRLASVEPLSKEKMKEYYEKDYLNKDGIVLIVEVVNKIDKTSIKFFKFCKFEELMEDNTTFLNNLEVVCEKKYKAYENTLLLKKESVPKLMFCVRDLHYSSECRNNIDAICKRTQIRNLKKESNSEDEKI